MRPEKLYEGVRTMPSVADELLTRKDVCRIFKISLQTVIRLEQAGKLPAIRLGAGSVRYQRSDVAKLIADCLSK